MNKIIKKYTYDEFGMYANGEPVRPIVCLLLGLLRVPNVAHIYTSKKNHPMLQHEVIRYLP